MRKARTRRMYFSKLKPVDVHKNQIKTLLFKKRFYKLVIFLIFIGTVLYIVDFSTNSIDLPSKLEFYTRLIRFKGDPDGWNGDDKDSEHYYVNTVGCKMPTFAIHDSFVQKYIVKEKPPKCKAPLTNSDDKYLWIGLDHRHMSKVYDIKNTSMLRCYYEAFHRRNDFSVDYEKNLTFFEYGSKIRVDKEFIKVACDYGDRGFIYKDYHVFPQKTKPALLTDDKGEANKINVMIFGLDSVSRLNLRRQMNATVHYLVNSLNGFEFLGYNKVGDNTYPNLIPVLTGFDIEELTASCLPFENSTYDDCYFMWDQFSKIGYKTLFAEDITWVGLFNFFRKGFQQQPTNYFLRNILSEMEKKIANFRRGNFDLCLGGRTPLDFVLEYMQKFVKVTADEPTFSFFWSSSMTHDFLNSPKLIDYKIRNVLKTMNLEGHLNKTFLILMSDHGMRWGKFRNTYQGMIEERQPFLFVIAPAWFQTKYSLAMKNLRRNKRFLTTPFDLHATLKDLVKPDDLLTDTAIRQRTKQLIVNEPIPRGISLFLPIPATRTCETAAIAAHWCTCHERRPLSNSDARVQMVARFVVKSINDQIRSFPQCHKLYLKSISEANLGITNDVIFSKNPTNYICDITVRVETKPGLGEFEATVRLNSDNVSTLTGIISRTNLYGKQSSCIDDYAKKLYCYCGS